MLLKTARKIVVGLIGGTVVLIGVIMLVTPGPAFIVIPAGLAILATEFVFARRLLKRIKQGALAMASRAGVIATQPKSPDQDHARVTGADSGRAPGA